MIKIGNQELIADYRDIVETAKSFGEVGGVSANGELKTAKTYDVFVAKLEEVIKERELSEKMDDMKNIIYSYYPAQKQSQDLMWSNSYRTKLVAMGEDAVEAQVVALATAVFGGQSVEEAVSGVDADKQRYYTKLVKIAVRSQWAEDCIAEGLTAIAEDREPNYPVFPAL